MAQGVPELWLGWKSLFREGGAKKGKHGVARKRGKGVHLKAVEKKKWNADHENGGRWTLRMVWNARLKVG